MRRIRPAAPPRLVDAAVGREAHDPPGADGLAELENDPDIQVVVFASELPDFFINHFDAAAAADLPVPVPEDEDDNPLWTDMVLRLNKAPFVSIAAIRPSPATCATPVAAAHWRRSRPAPTTTSTWPHTGGG